MINQKNHQATLEVNLDALVHNYQVYKKHLNQDTKIMVMVKASAYGSGDLEVAKKLETNGVDYLSVAYPQEGLSLRQKGIQSPIMVLNPVQPFNTIIEHQLEPVIYSLSQFQNFLKNLSKNQQYPIHINIDTGMKRLGFDQTDFKKLQELLLQNQDKIHIKSIFSHFSVGETPQEDPFTHQQAQLFEECYQQITKAINYLPCKHISNSCSILRFPQYQYDMVRLGIGIYGVDDTNLVQNQLQVVNTFKTRIAQIKSIKKGETIGYGRTGQLPNGGKIATINVGYADGFLRLAGNGNFKAWIKGQFAPTIGNVCMDMSMLDVSHLPNVNEGDEVEIFGQNLPVTHLAKSLKTIPYEVFTNISERIKRVYIQK